MPFEFFAINWIYKVTNWRNYTVQIITF